MDLPYIVGCCRHLLGLVVGVKGEQDRVENPASTLLAKLSSVAWGSVYLEIGHLAPILTKAP